MAKLINKASSQLTRFLGLVFILYLSLNLNLKASENSSSLVLKSNSCESFLALFETQWHSAIIAGLQGDSMEDIANAAGIETSLAGNDTRVKFLDRATADELVHQGLKKPSDIYQAVLAFPVLDPSKKLEFIEHITERIVNVLDSGHDVSDLVKVAETSKRYGMKVNEYIQFLNYWKKSQLRDPYLSELKFAILYNIMRNTSEAALRISKYRTLSARIADRLRGRKTPKRGPQIIKLSEDENIVSIFNNSSQSALNTEITQYLESISPAGRRYFFYQNYKKMNAADVDYFLSKYGQELDAELKLKIQEHQKILLEIQEKFNIRISEAQRISEELNQSLRSLNQKISGRSENSQNPLHPNEWKALLVNLDVLTGGSSTQNVAIERLLETYRERLKREEFLILVSKIKKIMGSYNSVDAQIAAIKVLQYNSRWISLEDEDRNAFVEWMLKETKNYSNWARYTSEFLNLSRQQWGRVPVEIPEAQKSQLLKEQAAIKASIKEINQQSEKLRQEIIEELLAKGL
ncbi:MAG: hypothetical protein KA116_05915 [Proteobacteria bacterium]|nr:hypothetical protein [Pseudomonadota bacterium]